jgi:transcriptional regulator of acetoin/glycerol metabolism
MWIDGNRKSFQIPNEYIDDQLRLLDKSLNYISTFTEYSTDRFGNNNLGQVLKEKTDIGLGKSVEVRRGVSITREQANQIKKLYLKFNKNVTEVAKFLGVSRPTIYKALKIE